MVEPAEPRASALRELTSARQRNALRHWLAGLTLAPDENHWAGWECLRDAKPDATPRWRLEGGELQRSGERVWWLPDGWLASVSGPVDWPDPSVELQLPGNGSLRLEGRRPLAGCRFAIEAAVKSWLCPVAAGAISSAC